MNVRRELIEVFFKRENKKVDSTLPLFDKLEEVIDDHIDFEVSFYGEMPWFTISDDYITLLIIVNDESDNEFDVEFKITLTGKITWFEISNIEGLNQEYDIE